MNLKPTMSYYLKNSAKVLTRYYAIWAGITILFSALVTIVSVGGGVSNSGMEMVTTVIIFILGLCSFKDELHFFLQNGVSRRTAFISFFLHLAILCAATAAAEMIVGWVLEAIVNLMNADKGSYISLFEMFYGGRTMFTGVFSGGVVRYIWTFTLFLIAGTAGYLVTNIYYFFNKWGKVILSVGVWGGVFVLYPAADYYLFDGAIGRALSSFMGFLFGIDKGFNPLYFVVICIIASALLAACTWPLTRRAKIKKS